MLTERQEEMIYYEGYRRGYADAEPKWIPCSERMPEHTSDYLVMVGVNYEGEGMSDYVRVALYNIVFKDWLIRETDKAIIGQPVAWMPLPEPWKGEDDE